MLSSFNSDTYIEVLSTRDLPSKIVTAASNKTVSRTLNSVTINQAGVYNCSARVFYNGTLSSYVTNSTISSTMSAILTIISEFLTAYTYFFLIF